MIRGVVDLNPHWFAVLAGLLDPICKSLALPVSYSVAGHYLVLSWRWSLSVEAVAEDVYAVSCSVRGGRRCVRWRVVLRIENGKALAEEIISICCQK